MPNPSRGAEAARRVFGALLAKGRVAANAFVLEELRKADWAEFVPAMRNRVIRFEVVDEEEWKLRLNALLAG